MALSYYTSKHNIDDIYIKRLNEFVDKLGSSMAFDSKGIGNNIVDFMLRYEELLKAEFIANYLKLDSKIIDKINQKIRNTDKVFSLSSKVDLALKGAVIELNKILLVIT